MAPKKTTKKTTKKATASKAKAKKAPAKTTSKPASSKKPTPKKSPRKKSTKSRIKSAAKTTKARIKSAAKTTPQLTKSRKKAFIKQHLQHYVVAFYAIAFINIVLLIAVFTGNWILTPSAKVPVYETKPDVEEEILYDSIRTLVTLDQLDGYQPEVKGREIEIAVPDGRIKLTLSDYQLAITHNENTYQLERPPSQRIIISPLGGPNRPKAMQVEVEDNRFTINGECLSNRDFFDVNSNIRIMGTNRNDVIKVDNLLEPVMIQGLQGSDVLNISGAKCNSNWVDGGWGSDNITGSNFADRLSGGLHQYQQIDNRLISIDGCVADRQAVSIRDQITGRGGDDLIIGCEGNDILKGGQGNDTIFGDDSHFENNLVSSTQNYSDDIDGGFGNDYLRGGPGNDTIRGGPGNDVIQGDSGDNTLSGGGGNDELWDIN